ncbi:MAG: class A beta-lactamase [Acidobacteriota bacterium]
MKGQIFITTFIFLVLFSACSGQINTEARKTGSARRSEVKDPSIRNEVAKIAAEAKGKVGVYVLNLKTAEYFSFNGDGHFPMQSVYKLPISLAVIKKFEDQHLDLEEKITVTKDDMVGPNQHSPLRDKFPYGTQISVRELIKYALQESDGSAGDVVMHVAGGPERIQTYLGTIGITNMKILSTEKQIGAAWETQYKNRSTPKAAVDLLRALQEGRALSNEGDRQMVLRMMTESSPGANRIRGLLGDTPVAHKTGTSGTKDGITAATNDIGIVTLPNGRRLAIAVFVRDSPADEKTREATIAKVTKVIFDHLKTGK